MPPDVSFFIGRCNNNNNNNNDNNNNNNNNNNVLISVLPWYGSSPDIKVK